MENMNKFNNEPTLCISCINFHLIEFNYDNRLHKKCLINDDVFSECKLGDYKIKEKEFKLPIIKYCNKYNNRNTLTE